MKSLISCILLLSSFLTPVVAQAKLHNEHEESVANARMAGEQNEDSLNGVNMEKEKELLRHITLTSESYNKHKYTLSKAAKISEALETYRKGIVDKCIKRRLDYEQKLDVSYNHDDGTSIAGDRKKTQRPISCRKYNGNCLNLQVKESQLLNALKGIDLSKYDGLKITGTLNTADVRTIRTLYGAEDATVPMLKDSLLLLDLSDAKFRDDKTVYMTRNATKEGMVIKKTVTMSARSRDRATSAPILIYTDSDTFDFSTMTRKEWIIFKAVLGTEQNDMYFTEGADGDYYVHHFVSSKKFPSAMMWGCSSLQCIVLPRKCKEFDQYAVFNCENLKVVAYSKKTVIIYRHPELARLSKQYDKTFVYEP